MERMAMEEEPTGQEQPPGAPPKKKRTRKNSKARRDKAKRLIKPRDCKVLPWIGEQYAARLDQVQELLSQRPGKGGKKVSPTGLTLSAVLQVVDRWVDLGLVQYKRIHDGEPGWIWLTPYALRLLHLPYKMLTPADSTLHHLYNINRIRLDVEHRHPEYQWVSERTLRAAQPRRERGTVLAHLPDAQVRTPKLVAAEVERSPKSPEELDEILDRTPHRGEYLRRRGETPDLHDGLVLCDSQDAHGGRGGARPLAARLSAAGEGAFA